VNSQHQRTDQDQEQVVLRKRAARDGYRAAQARSARPEEIFRTPAPERGVLDDQQQGKGGKKLQQLGRSVDSSQNGNFDEKSKGSHDCRGEGYGGPESDPLRQPHRQEHAQHVERAVGEVDDPRDPEDEGQAGGDQEQR